MREKKSEAGVIERRTLSPTFKKKEPFPKPKICICQKKAVPLCPILRY